MFRVLVDFDEDIPLADDSLEQFAQLMKTRTSEEGMAPLTGAAVARLATYSARLAEHQGRLSARIGDLFQLVSEADFIRQLAGESITDVGHIERALKAKATRTGRVSARIIDDMLAGIILIDTCGAAVGKCNGLTVLEVGEAAGHPDEQGRFPKGSVNARVVERLRDIAEIGLEEEIKPADTDKAKAATEAAAAKPARAPRRKKDEGAAS